MTKDELLKTYSIAAVVQMATMTGIIKQVREVGKDFSERAIEAVLEKMYPELKMLNMDEVIKIGDTVRETLGIPPMTFSKVDNNEISVALAAANQRPALPLSRRMHRMMANTMTSEGWVSIDGVKYAVTPSFNADYEGDTPYNLLKPTEAK